jgi:hypothetical protein
MVNYSDGKIYRIVCGKTGLYYIGSTAEKYLSKRLQKHISQYKLYKAGKTTTKVTSFNIIELGDFSIELIETYSCSNVYELRKREGEVLKEHIGNELCVNKLMAYGVKKKGNYNYNKEYNELTKEVIIQQKGIEYYELHKAEIAQKQKEYYEINKAQIAQKKKEYYELNKVEVAQQRNQKVLCDCGVYISSSNLTRHKGTDRHIYRMKHLMLMIDLMFNDEIIII